MNPLAEARARVGDAYDVRVLEPAPPAITSEPFSDDPMARGEVAAGHTLVAPFVTGVDGDLTWDALARGDADLATWCAERALGAWAPLPPIADVSAYTRTREALHAVAEHVLCPARHRANGKIGLRFTRGGFGTPFFGADEQLRVERGVLVRTVGDEDSRLPLTTIGAAASDAGIEPGAPDVYTPTTPLALDRLLVFDDRGLEVIGWWYGFAAAVLAQVRADSESNPADAPPPSLAQIWPEHFDLATDLGAGGARANFGASPGDVAHPGPYLYVGPWGEHAPDPYWNESFGASLRYADLVAAPDAYERALAFFREGRTLLTS